MGYQNNAKKGRQPFLESITTQPAQPSSGRIAHLFPRFFVCFGVVFNSMPRAALHLHGVIHIKVLRT
ncbi:MAG: hypothetical protein LBL62_04030 [Planctomycetaceae bacterium]|nr:hypothetical protein [Planctomycetaceae bacterium]